MREIKYIALEGADGTAKSTLAKNIANILGYGFMYEPFGETLVCKSLRAFCLDKEYYSQIPGEAREYMMLANRAISTTIVKTELEMRKGIIQDRSLVSGMVYAQVASAYSKQDWWAIAEKAFVVKPDLIVHVSTPVQNIEKTKGDIYDHANDDFHTRIREEFVPTCEWMKVNQGIEYINYQHEFHIGEKEMALELLDLIKYKGYTLAD